MKLILCRFYYTKIKRIFDISPETETLIKEQSLARLHELGWLENIMEFSQEEE